uniref:Secreted protein n=1 Tax=Panagrellus redivivus TaxID=6233 RepID=A0A7E4W8B2_PANRE
MRSPSDTPPVVVVVVVAPTACGRAAFDRRTQTEKITLARCVVCWLARVWLIIDIVWLLGRMHAMLRNAMCVREENKREG